MITSPVYNITYFTYGGFEFACQEWNECGLNIRVYAKPGQFHPRYVLFSDTRMDADEADNAPLRVNKLNNAALSIITNHERWIKECEERGGEPPPEVSR